jgi:type IV pilus assembly protein PilV
MNTHAAMRRRQAGMAPNGRQAGTAPVGRQAGTAPVGRQAGTALIGRQAGLTLIEVLVAILIFSFGLLGFVGLQARAIQFSVGAEDTNRAALLANEMGTLLVTRLPPGVAIDLSGLSTDIAAWQARAASATGAGLPNGAASVAASGNAATITVTWRPANAASNGAASTNRYVTDVVLP